MALSRKQLEAIKLGYDTNLNGQQICAEIGVAPSTYVRWKKKPEYIRAQREYINKFMGDKIPLLAKNMLKLAFSSRSEIVKFNATKEIIDNYQRYIDKDVATLRRVQAEADIAEAKVEAIKANGGDIEKIQIVDDLSYREAKDAADKNK